MSLRADLVYVSLLHHNQQVTVSKAFPGATTWRFYWATWFWFRRQGCYSVILSATSENLRSKTIERRKLFLQEIHCLWSRTSYHFQKEVKEWMRNFQCVEPTNSIPIQRTCRHPMRCREAAYNSPSMELLFDWRKQTLISTVTPSLTQFRVA